jgi:hypothetical protein
VINLAGVRPLDPADYFGYLKQSNGRLVFIQRQGEQTATLLVGNDDNWAPFEVADGRPNFPLLDDRDQFWLGACWHHSSNLRPQPDPPAETFMDYTLGRALPPVQTAICKHCQQPIQALSSKNGPLRWTHADTSRGCRAASFRPGLGWNESLDRKWKASPSGKRTSVAGRRPR